MLRRQRFKFRRHLDDIKKYVPEFIPEFVPEFSLNTNFYSGTNSGMNSGTNFSLCRLNCALRFDFSHLEEGGVAKALVYRAVSVLPAVSLGQHVVRGLVNQVLQVVQDVVGSLHQGHEIAQEARPTVSGVQSCRDSSLI